MKINQRVMLTKKMLQEAMLRLLEEKPMDKIHVTELCENAGINRATFYRHYQLPRDVLEEMQHCFVERVQTDFAAESVIYEPERYMDDLCQYLYDNRDLITVFMHNNAEDDIFDYIKEPFRELVEYYASMQKREDDAEEQELLCAYIAGGSYFMLRQWLLEGMKKTPQEIARFILSLMDNDGVGR